MNKYREAKEGNWIYSEAYPNEVYNPSKEAAKQVAKTRPDVPHYRQGKIESIDYINDHGFNFNLGCAIKYITRCNYKGSKKQDLLKAIDYLNFELERD